ncbi:hypothetical protein BJY04DRAFT_135799 [Aspergillus karnatakaensis]|uniref:uncharacterized protein n=1 Tax=Aspergillus karnatakaensis TaxID=1810916 RepID=UPI003CCCBF10
MFHLMSQPRHQQGRLCLTLIGDRIRRKCGECEAKSTNPDLFLFYLFEHPSYGSRSESQRTRDDLWGPPGSAMRSLPQQTSRLIRIAIKYFRHRRTKAPSHDRFFMHDNVS